MNIRIQLQVGLCIYLICINIMIKVSKGDFLQFPKK